MRFTFNIDVKETIWVKYEAMVEANNEEEAILKMKEIAKNPDYDKYVITSEFLYETSEDMTYEQNGNQPTIEVYYKDVMLENNTPLYIIRDIKIDKILKK